MNLDSRSINEQLQNLYTEYWDALTQAIPRRRGYSFPLLMNANTSYPVAPIKTMVIGQQTNGWQDEFGSQPATESVSALMSKYQEFNLGEKWPSPFFKASHLLQHTINPYIDLYGIMWSNLVRVDYKRERAEAIEDSICRIPLLRHEIEIVQPKVIVFFTGPKYDERLKATFPDVAISVIPGHKLLAQLEHPQLPLRTYRTYHPGYLKRMKQTESTINKIADLARSA